MLIIRIIPVKMTTSGQLSADRALSAACDLTRSLGRRLCHRIHTFSLYP